MTEFNIYKYLGEKIRELRKKAGLSQKELAERAKVTQPQLSKFEVSGEELRTAKSINDLFEALGYQLDGIEKKLCYPRHSSSISI